MASINYAFKEIISKIVYYGPGLSGKTTNLQYVFKKVPAETRGELISLATDADRTLYFDFLPVNVGTIQGFATKFQLYTVPGQVYYNATRKLVLRGVDGIVFVADSQLEKMDENIESLANLKENLQEYGYDIEKIPVVIQYNKRDLPNAADVELLQKALNPKGFSYFEAVASTGEGVFKTLKAICKIVLDEVRKNRKSTIAVKPQPVGVAASSVKTESEIRSQSNLDAGQRGAKDEGSILSELEHKKPSIGAEVGARTTVVVSDDSEEKTDTQGTECEKDDTEETTERAVLEEKPNGSADSSVLNDSVSSQDDKTGEGIITAPSYGMPYGEMKFDEEATQLSDLNFKNPIFLGKPQMAESKKVKKKKGLNLFGWLKKGRSQ